MTKRETVPSADVRNSHLQERQVLDAKTVTANVNGVQTSKENSIPQNCLCTDFLYFLSAFKNLSFWDGPLVRRQGMDALKNWGFFGNNLCPPPSDCTMHLSL